MLIISENDRSNYLIYNKFFKLITLKTKEEEKLQCCPWNEI